MYCHDCNVILFSDIYNFFHTIRDVYELKETLIGGKNTKIVIKQLLVLRFHV